MFIDYYYPEKNAPKYVLRVIALTEIFSVIAGYSLDTKMTSFALNSGDHYVKSVNVFIKKSGERGKIFELLEEHISPSVQRSLALCQQRSRLNILSVGSGSGEVDLDVLKIVKQELQKSERCRDMKIFNRAIEPSEYSCGLYKDAIVN